MKAKTYLIHCGDCEFYFKFGALYKWSYLRRVFQKRINQYAENFFPGLVLRDGQGKLWKPTIAVVLEPAGETDEEVPTEESD